MSNYLNLKSKKGISLAYALVVCLFLIMITGGITTIAILQQNETGSDLNTRQAYISAKGGLSTMRDALKDNVVSSGDLPSDSVRQKYYVMYQSASGGPVRYKVFTSEADAQAELETLQADDAWEIIGGEGTYFRMTYNNPGDYGVTALNTTGRYNNNVSINKGDLSFEAVSYTQYVFDLDPTSPPTTPTTATTPTSTESPITPTQPGTVPHSPPSSNAGGNFLLVSQQTALNENRSNTNGYSSGKSLNKISNNDNQIFYEGDTNAKFENNRTYFPVVMDRTFMANTQNDNSITAAYNQGVYFLGSFNGPKVNNASRADNNGQGQDLGNVSYFEENTEFGQSIRCALLVIKNNFVTRSNNGINNAPKVIYYGDGDKNKWYGEHYVYVYLPNEVKFWLCNENAYVHRDGTFTRGAGYWMVKSGRSLYDQSAWQPMPQALLQSAMDLNLYDQIMSYYENGGEIHTGCNESGYIPNNIAITGNNGAYRTNTPDSGDDNSRDVDIYPSSGYDNSRDVDSYPFSGQDRSRANIFFAPNMSPTNAGYYHWYAGRSFNMQWFRSDTRYEYRDNREDQTGIDADFVVGNNVNIRISSPTVVLTIGPTVTWNNPTIHFDLVGNISNTVKKEGNGSFKLYGFNNGRAEGSCKLMVMVPFQVKYDGKSYTVAEGTYTNVPAGLELFSDSAKYFFTGTAASGGSSLRTSTGSENRLIPAGIGFSTGSSFNQSNVFTSVFSNILNLVSPATTFTPLAGSDTLTLTAADLSGNSTVTFSKKLAKPKYLNPDAAGKINVLPIMDLSVKQELSNGTTVEAIKFATAGTYNIPVVGNENVVGVAFRGDILRQRSTLKTDGSNYHIVSQETKFDVASERYY